MNHLRKTSPVQAGGCPDNCAGGATKQRRLTSVELCHISIEARHEIFTWPGSGFVCDYCGCVYIREGIFTRRLDVLMGGWHPALFPPKRAEAISLDQ